MTTAHCPSAANNIYWPELYTNMPIVDPSRPHPYGDTPSPKRFGTVSPLDPQLFSGIDEFAMEMVTGRSSGKYSPAEVAAWLGDLADSASRELSNAEARTSDAHGASFRRTALDVAILSGLGHFFAGKLRAGVLYALYTRTGDPALLTEAVRAYRTARDAWATLASRASGAYVRDITFGWDNYARGHWSDRLTAIDDDIADMEKRSQEKRPTTHPVAGIESIAAVVAAVLTPADRPSVPVNQVPPASFQRGRTVQLTLRLPNDRERGLTLRAYYRQVNQAEGYRALDMERTADGSGEYSATIPAEYTDSPYPLQYYFELRDAASRAWLFPGFNRDRTNQPYFVVQQSRAARGRT